MHNADVSRILHWWFRFTEIIENGQAAMAFLDICSPVILSNLGFTATIERLQYDDMQHMLAFTVYSQAMPSTYVLSSVAPFQVGIFLCGFRTRIRLSLTLSLSLSLSLSVCVSAATNRERASFF